MLVLLLHTNFMSGQCMQIFFEFHVVNLWHVHLYTVELGSSVTKENVQVYIHTTLDKCFV